MHSRARERERWCVCAVRALMCVVCAFLCSVCVHTCVQCVRTCLCVEYVYISVYCASACPCRVCMGECLCALSMCALLCAACLSVQCICVHICVLCMFICMLCVCISVCSMCARTYALYSVLAFYSVWENWALEKVQALQESAEQMPFSSVMCLLRTLVAVVSIMS